MGGASAETRRGKTGTGKSGVGGRCTEAKDAHEGTTLVEEEVD